MERVEVKTDHISFVYNPNDFEVTSIKSEMTEAQDVSPAMSNLPLDFSIKRAPQPEDLPIEIIPCNGVAPPPAHTAPAGAGLADRPLDVVITPDIVLDNLTQSPNIGKTAKSVEVGLLQRLGSNGVSIIPEKCIDRLDNTAKNLDNLINRPHNNVAIEVNTSPHSAGKSKKELNIDSFNKRLEIIIGRLHKAPEKIVRHSPETSDIIEKDRTPENCKEVKNNKNPDDIIEKLKSVSQIVINRINTAPDTNKRPNEPTKSNSNEPETLLGILKQPPKNDPQTSSTLLDILKNNSENNKQNLELQSKDLNVKTCSRKSLPENNLRVLKPDKINQIVCNEKNEPDIITQDQNQTACEATILVESVVVKIEPDESYESETINDMNSQVRQEIEIVPDVAPYLCRNDSETSETAPSTIKQEAPEVLPEISVNLNMDYNYRTEGYPYCDVKREAEEPYLEDISMNTPEIMRQNFKTEGGALGASLPEDMVVDIPPRDVMFRGHDNHYDEPNSYSSDQDEKPAFILPDAAVSELMEKLTAVEGRYSCPLCHKLFVNKYNVARHLVLHTRRADWACALCGKGFHSQAALQRHADRHGARRAFPCATCGKAFRSSSNLAQHARVHAADKAFTCDLCGKTFNFRSNLDKHRGHRQCKPPRELKCPVCDKQFYKEYLLKSHLRRHDDERPFACDLCGMQFKHKSTIIRHMTLHFGEKLFACKVCGKKFTTRGLVKPHMRTHSGEKPFECPLCRKKFSHKHNMERHLQNHSKVKRLECEICGRRFPRESRLKYHMRVHTKQKPFACRICAQTFSHKQSIVRHYQKKHPAAPIEEAKAGQEHHLSIDESLRLIKTEGAAGLLAST